MQPIESDKEEPNTEPGEQEKNTEASETVRILKLEEDLVADDEGGADPYNAGQIDSKD